MVSFLFFKTRKVFLIVCCCRLVWWSTIQSCHEHSERKDFWPNECYKWAQTNETWLAGNANFFCHQKRNGVPQVWTSTGPTPSKNIIYWLIVFRTRFEKNPFLGPHWCPRVQVQTNGNGHWRSHGQGISGRHWQISQKQIESHSFKNNHFVVPILCLRWPNNVSTLAPSLDCF